ncbi:MAG: acetolactate synthase large subunit [Methanosphaera sp.]|uniref:acetolactate synthase large subunit n=1 Tax=Methanosphaera sp. TaxID=2666342 RepID=UPI0025D45287|nr:acetolactate synthase large subunit [Methanosphaera sp.]MCI5866733.1 acetolactate synthase large subunit [Methanosphaera sp.]MDD6534248.1 acetolactate synthase large subunit [Methanosphaera sp.]MDY3956368.1 acetolactate synthase large subunit [Methanosphaera sp.]
MNGSEALLEKLKQNGTDTVFGYPGGSLLPLYDALYDSDLKHILVRHEQAAAHAADGYAKVSGKPGVCFATSGPGATNLLTGIATANIDSVPVVAITGQVNSNFIGTDGFQEVDTIGLTMPITKANFQPRKSEKLPETIDAAFHIASTGRKGVVVVDVPKDVLENEVTKEDMERLFDIPGYNPTIVGNPRQIKRVIKVIEESQKPIIIAGGGVINSDASEELLKFAEAANIAVATTLMGKGAIDEDHPLAIGHLGMHGLESTNNAVVDCDCLIAIGCRFSDRTTGKVSEFAKNAVKIQIDIDPAEIGKNIPVDYPIVGDAKEVLCDLNNEIRNPNNNGWTDKVVANNQAYHPKMTFDDGILKPQECIKEIMEAITPTTIVSTDVGQNQMWMAHYFKAKNPRTFLSSGGLGTMGYGFPAAIGAQVAKPDENVLAVVGDGGFQMVLQELATIEEYDLPVVTCILDNRYLGMVYQWQVLYYNNRISQTKMTPKPDFVKLADSYGIEGVRIERPGELKEAIETAFKNREPTVIDAIIDPSELLPMAPPGEKITNILGTYKTED